MWIAFEYSFSRMIDKSPKTTWSWGAMLEGAIWADSFLDLANKQFNFKNWLICFVFAKKVDRNGDGQVKFEDLFTIGLDCAK